MKRRIVTLLPALLDIVVPTLGYFILHALGLSDTWALTVSGSSAGILTLVNSIRKRHIDTLGALVFLELVASVVLSVVTHDPRLILARAALYVAIGGAVALGSAFVGRPLTYAAATPMATKGDPERARAYAAAWDNSAQLRRIHAQLSILIGAGMIAYAVLRVVIIYTASSVSEAIWAQEIPGLLLIAGCVLAIRLRVPALHRIVDAEQAALAPATPEQTIPAA